MMTKPTIVSLQPIVLADNRRVTFDLEVENLPESVFNVNFIPTADPLPRPDPSAPSPYPNVELSVVNNRGETIASLFIVEHKEPHTTLTLHLPAPDPAESYIARADMTYQDRLLDRVEVRFNLQPNDSNV